MSVILRVLRGCVSHTEGQSVVLRVLRGCVSRTEGTEGQCQSY